MKSLYGKSLISLVLYSHIIFASQVFAGTKPSTIFIQSNKSSDSDFKALVRNTKSAITLSDYVLESSPTLEDKQKLLTLLESAQKEFLEGSLEKSRVSFENIAAISRDSDWTIEERKSIFYSYLRLAHLSNEEVTRRKWLTEAARFDFEINPDKKIFTPPLCKEFDEIRKEEVFNAKNWDISSFKENIVAIKVNGKKYNAQYGGTIKLMNGSNRVVFISNKNMPIIKVLNANQAMATTIPSDYFSIGSCNYPITDNVPSSLKTRSAIYFSQDCIIAFEDGKWKPKSQNQFLVLNNPSAGASISENAIEQQISIHNKNEENSKSSNSNKKYWLLGLVAAGIATALVLSSQKDSEPGKQPTHQ